jgi:hypothetical protein
MTAIAQTNTLTGQSDAVGNCVVRAAGNYELQRQGAWNLYVQLSGFQNGVVTVLLDGNPTDSGLTTNRAVKFGPVFLNGSSTLSVTVVGMTPNEPVTVTMTGIISNDPADYAALASPGYGGGSVQNDPSQLLTAQSGNPLIENVTAQIPHLGLNPNWLTFGANYPGGLGGGVPPLGPLIPFNISGYSALFIDVDPNTAVNDLWMIIQWQDSLGNLITTTEIGSLCPLFRGLVIAHGVQCTILIVNNGGVNHGVNAFTVIPYVQVPAKPDLLLDNGPLITPIAPAALDSHYILSAVPAVLFGTTVTVVASMVWNGRAIWAIGTGSNTYHARLFYTDALGNIVNIADIYNIPGGVLEVQLPAALVSCSINNTAASGTINPPTTLIATS